MSIGSLFAGWVMHATGRYKFINLIFGIFPFIGAVSIYMLKIDSNFWMQWFSIVSSPQAIMATRRSSANLRFSLDPTGLR